MRRFEQAAANRCAIRLVGGVQIDDLERLGMFEGHGALRVKSERYG